MNSEGEQLPSCPAGSPPLPLNVNCAAWVDGLLTREPPSLGTQKPSRNHYS